MENGKHVLVLHKVLFSENNKMTFFRVAIMEKQIAFSDRDTFNPNPVIYPLV